MGHGGLRGGTRRWDRLGPLMAGVVVAVGLGLVGGELAGQEGPGLPSREQMAAAVEAAMAGDAAAQEAVCVAWFAGARHVTAAAGLSWCRKAADAGSLNARFVVADVTIDGRAPGADPEAGFRMLRALAEEGYPPAMLRLADRKMTGNGTAVDRPEACRWLRSLAEDHDDAAAQFWWGGCLMLGDGVEPDDEAGLAMIERSAAQGFPHAVEYLAEGEGEPTDAPDAWSDPEETLSAIRRAAEAGDAAAQRWLGEMYMSGSEGLERDRGRAMEWLRRAADNGDPEAQFIVGSQLYAGPQQDQDFAEAWVYLTAAVEQGHSIAGDVRDDLERYMNDALRARAEARLEELRTAGAIDGP